MTGRFIKSLSSGGVITNYHCVSRCGHCLYNCGPHRRKDYLDPGLAHDIFSTIAALGCRSVHIGGGEPLLNPSKLLAVLDSARKVGMKIDYVETDSAWFVDSKKARSLLKDLPEHNVCTLLVSISPFHNAFVPFDRVMGVIDACRQTNMNDLKARLPSGKYKLLDQLAAAGIRGLFDFAHRKFNYVPSKRTFLNHCDLCTDIRNFLLHLKTETFPELEPEDFYNRY